MRETIQLVAAFKELVAAGERGVLATVIYVQGSTYRLPGARMLLQGNTAVAGLVSGGCLEADLLDRAKPVLHDGKATTVHYDHTAKEDIVWGLGLGCAGVVDILLELVDADHPGPLDLLRRCLQARQPGVIATVISPGERLAGRWMQYPDGVTVTDNWFEQAPDLTVLTGQRTGYSRYGQDKVLIERIDPRIRLVVFGGGPDVVPLAAMADSLGWCVEVYSDRGSGVPPLSLAQTVTVQHCRPEHAAQTVTVGDRTALVLMTHHYPGDKILLQTYAASDAGYIGVLGPKQRTDMMLAELDASDIASGLADKLYAPVGLDIGGEAPEEIALAIIAEIQSVFNQRQGGFLRSRNAPIHERHD